MNEILVRLRENVLLGGMYFDTGAAPSGAGPGAALAPGPARAARPGGPPGPPGPWIHRPLPRTADTACGIAPNPPDPPFPALPGPRTSVEPPGPPSLQVNTRPSQPQPCSTDEPPVGLGPPILSQTDATRELCSLQGSLLACSASSDLGLGRAGLIRSLIRPRWFDSVCSMPVCSAKQPGTRTHRSDPVCP